MNLLVIFIGVLVIGFSESRKLFTFRRGDDKRAANLALIEGSYGGAGGTAFSDNGGGPILQVILYSASNSYLSGIEVIYATGFDSNGQYLPSAPAQGQKYSSGGVLHGSATGTAQILTINNSPAPYAPRQYVSAVSGRYGTYINSLTLKRSDGSSITSGAATGGTSFSESAPNYQMLAAVSGSSSSYINNLNFVWMGPIASFFFPADASGTTTFEISNQHPQASVSSVTFYTSSNKGTTYICGLQISGAGQTSVLAGVTGTANTITIPSGNMVEIGVVSCNFGGASASMPAGMTSGMPAICGVVVSLYQGASPYPFITSHTVGASAPIAFATTYRDYQGLGSGLIFRGFKGTFISGQPTSFVFLVQD